MRNVHSVRMALLIRVTVLLSCILSLLALKRGNLVLVTLITDFDGNIYRYDQNESQLTRIPVSDSGQGPEAIDFDPVESQIYWTNIRADTIKRANLDGSNEETILSATETPRGVAVDYINRLMFYTEEKLDIVGMVNLTGLSRSTILRTGMDRPLAITLDMKKKIFYWTDIGTNAKIEKAYYDGTGRTTLVRRGLTWPIALALDETREKLFWCDGSVKKIQFIDLGTMKVTVVIYKYGTHYYDLNYVDGTIFFVDLLQRNAFQSIPASGGTVKKYPLQITMSKWRKIRVIKTTVCEDMTWGDNCTKNCGKCLADAVCNKYTGHCPSGCQIGFAKPTCENVCPNGSYGLGCNSTCGKCRDTYSCNPVTGLCLYGCADGWDGKYCRDECQNGHHGPKCSIICGHCRDGDVCDKQTGNCSNGCEAGWRGAQCKQTCLNGTFGVDCQYACQCVDGVACNTLTGECPRENITLRVCPDDRYGFNCSKPCGHCMDGQPCGETTGQCPGDCMPGWKGKMCQTECTGGWYGVGCSQICACRGSEACDGASGRCYSIPQVTPQKQVGESHFSDTPLTAGLCVVIVVLAILLAVAVVYIYRRKRLESTSSSSQESLSAEKEFSSSFNTSHDPLINA